MRKKSQNSCLAGRRAKVKCQNQVRLGQNRVRLGQNLNTIIEQTRIDLLKRKQRVPVSVILSKTKDIYSSASPASGPASTRLGEAGVASPQNDNPFYKFIQSTKHGTIAIIAEIKFASPTNLHLGTPKKLLNYVNAYQQAGCDAISIITEKHFFNGRRYYVTRIKEHTNLPLLQKDFVIDEYQIVESKYLGADAILLITKILDQKTLTKFVKFAQSLKIEPVVEIADKKDLQKAVKTSVKIIAANARNLDTFKVNVDEACLLLKQIPDKFTKLGFSGICSKREVEMYKQAGAQGILVGTALMKAADIKQFILSLRKA